MKIDLRQGFLEKLKPEVLQSLDAEERAVIEVSTGDLGNKPDAVKLGWLRMRTGDPWTKPRYQSALRKVLARLSGLVSEAAKGS